MIVAPVIVLYAALACATVVPPPGGKLTGDKIERPTTKPAWDLLGVCTYLNEQGVQKHPSLNPPPY